MSYRVLVLDSNATKMSLPVLRKISALVKAGAMVAGVKPTATPSLADDQNEFNKLVNEIWSSSNTKVTEGKSLSEVLNVVPDFAYTKPNGSTKLLYVHRKTTDRDIYWVNSRTSDVQDLEATFRVDGKVPELWFAETGKTEPLSYSIANAVTKVKLHLEPNDAFFIVFKDKATKASVELPALKVKELVTITGEWNLDFQKDRGAPGSIKVNELSSWSDNTNAGVKYFSGTGTYTKTITAPVEWFTKDAALWLNLGDVKNLAEVIVNGKSLGILWKKPFRANITSALRPGSNIVVVKVTNLWVNRLIGDAQPNVTKKITYTTMPFYQANSKLLPSGLLGPVQIISVNRK
jgi:(4-O-methyl)-D-glucuronate---lignin esterase